MGYLSLIFNKFHNKREVEIINEFRERIWKSLPYEKVNRKYTYRVSKEVEDKYIIEQFEKHSKVEYKVLKSRYKKNELMSEEFIKARINSNYGKYFDKEIYLDKQYYYHLANYKNIYFDYINGKSSDVLKQIESNTCEVKQLKKESENRKINMSWSEYKDLINGVIPKIFDNYIPMDIKIEKGEWKPNKNYEWDEDNYIIRYFNKSLDGYMKMHVNEIKGVRYSKGKRKKCMLCGKEIVLKSINSNAKYCNECAKKMKLLQNKKSYKKLRKT